MYLHPSLSPAVIKIVATGLVGLCLLYRALLPKPIRGIPYNKPAAKRLLGDVPDITAYASFDNNTIVSYVIRTMERLDSPLVQLFVSPFRKPLVVLGDFPEIDDILVRRGREFDRSVSFTAIFGHLGENHHIFKKSNAAWKVQRRYMGDSMTPAFLHTMVAPRIYQQVGRVVRLWHHKCSVARGRPWAADEDVRALGLDAIMGFVYGDVFGFQAVTARSSLLRITDGEEQREPNSTKDQAISFSERNIADPEVRATKELLETIGGTPASPWTLAYYRRALSMKKALAVKERYIRRELANAVERMQDHEPPMCIVDLLVAREKSSAENDEREPDYLSQVWVDEAMGTSNAGNENISSSINWGLKYLTDDPDIQATLRAALKSGFQAAIRERRAPTVEEIVESNIPYLDATISEIFRCSSVAISVEREAMVDTELLGYAIPKGTVVVCLMTGPSMTTPAFEIPSSKRRPANRAVLKDQDHIRSWDAKDIGEFNPGRWLGTDAEGKAEQFLPNAGPLLTFGLGARGCSGNKLAYLEVRIFWALVLWDFELLPCPESLSGYQVEVEGASKPRQCYVRLRRMVR
ncbi:cytochrome P450 monooxygenase [Aspergillus karnatakaensis]|uniref:cytochrome P450 monooxygenase n=1 Tax=Aspergillus karnatakaensis TaxID=1810916 RepID=UPI003CCD1F4A